MEVYVRALYDFEAVNVEELSFKKGDVILVTRKNVGGGWWEGVKEGILGLFPENFIEIIEDFSSGSEGEAEPDPEAETNPGFSLSKILPKKSSSTSNLLGLNEEIGIDDSGWICRRETFTITVGKVEKKKKYSGVQSYVSYEIKSDLSSQSVSRRYKNFEWLYDRLSERYPFIILPPLPDKQIQGRFDSEFIQQRKRRLERFLARLVRHPILRTSSVLHHFLTSSDTKGWKEGKRTAENQALSFSFLDSIKLYTVPKEEHGELLDKFLRFIRSMERHLHSLYTVSEHIQSKNESIESDFFKLSTSWELMVTSDDDRRMKVMEIIDQFKTKDKAGADSTNGALNNAGCWCWKEFCTECAPVSMALYQLSSTIYQVATSSKELGNFTKVAEQLKDFDREIKKFPNIIKLYEGCLNAYRTALTKEKEQQNIGLLKHRADVAALAVVAEIKFFHVSRTIDLKAIINEFVIDQANHHYQVAQFWENLLPSIESIQDFSPL